MPCLPRLCCCNVSSKHVLHVQCHSIPVMPHSSPPQGLDRVGRYTDLSRPPSLARVDQSVLDGGIPGIERHQHRGAVGLYRGDHCQLAVRALRAGPVCKTSKMDELCWTGTHRTSIESGDIVGAPLTPKGSPRRRRAAATTACGRASHRTNHGAAGDEVLREMRHEEERGLIHDTAAATSDARLPAGRAVASAVRVLAAGRRARHERRVAAEPPIMRRATLFVQQQIPVGEADGPVLQVLL
eukprot:SAG22_NODE_1253_length_5001_cov_12.062220_2_plen_241_part_00